MLCVSSFLENNRFDLWLLVYHVEKAGKWLEVYDVFELPDYLWLTIEESNNIFLFFYSASYLLAQLWLHPF